MGQPITVIEKQSSNPAVLRFETNRPLSGMGHERYTEPPAEILQRPVDELARRLFAAGGVEGIHINGSVVTVTLGGGRTGAGLGDVVRNLFLHYGEQPTAAVTPPTDEADRAPEAAADTAATPAAEQAEEPAAADSPADETMAQPEEAPAVEPAPAAEEAPAEEAPAAAVEEAPAADPAAAAEPAAGDETTGDA